MIACKITSFLVKMSVVEFCFVLFNLVIPCNEMNGIQKYYLA